MRSTRGGVPVLSRAEREAQPRQRAPRVRSPALHRSGLRRGRRRRGTSCRRGTSRSRARRSARAARVRPASTTPRTAPAVDDRVVGHAARRRQPAAAPAIVAAATRTYAGLSASARSARTDGPFDSFRKRACSETRSVSARHRAAERVDLAHELALRAAADRRVAGQRADAIGIAGDEQRLGAEPRRRERGFETRMAAADDDHGGVVAAQHGAHGTPPIVAQRRRPVRAATARARGGVREVPAAVICRCRTARRCRRGSLRSPRRR